MNKRRSGFLRSQRNFCSIKKLQKLQVKKLQPKKPQKADKIGRGGVDSLVLLNQRTKDEQRENRNSPQGGSIGMGTLLPAYPSLILTRGAANLRQEVHLFAAIEPVAIIRHQWRRVRYFPVPFQISVIGPVQAFCALEVLIRPET